MHRLSALSLPLVLLAVLAGLGFASLAHGALLIARHEVDAYHLMEIVLRMASGDLPHIDFVTPIGWLAAAPIAGFVAQGQGFGMAFLYAQIAVAAALMPLVWYVAATRFPGFLAHAFGAVVVVLCLALVYGGSGESLSISMHYNRWAWGLAFLLIPLAVMEPRGRRWAILEGAIIGALMAALVFLKVTFFIALAPGIALALLMRGARTEIMAAAAVGVASAIAATIAFGPQFWLAYVADLQTVAGSEIRPKPGGDFTDIIAAPKALAGSLILIASVIVLRKSEVLANEGLVLFALAPGFVYITYQNFGNDPKWLMLLALMLLAWASKELGDRTSKRLQLAGFAALAIASTSFINMAASPLRHAGLDIAEYSALTHDQSAHVDIQTWGKRAHRVDAKVPVMAADHAVAVIAARAEPTVFRGETLPDCQLEVGLSAWFQTIAAELNEAGVPSGAGILAADVLSSHWLFADYRPLEGGAPWYYGGLPGIDDADYLLVPLCPILPKIRDEILVNVGARPDLDPLEVLRTGNFVLYSLSGPKDYAQQ